MVVMPMILVILEAEAGGSQVRGLPQLHSQLEARMGNLVRSSPTIQKLLRM
jgi:hypothetical protein